MSELEELRAENALLKRTVEAARLELERVDGKLQDAETHVAQLYKLISQARGTLGE